MGSDLPNPEDLRTLDVKKKRWQLVLLTLASTFLLSLTISMYRATAFYAKDFGQEDKLNWYWFSLMCASGIGKIVVGIQATRFGSASAFKFYTFLIFCNTMMIMVFGDNDTVKYMNLFMIGFSTRGPFHTLLAVYWAERNDYVLKSWKCRQIVVFIIVLSFTFGSIFTWYFSTVANDNDSGFGKMASTLTLAIAISYFAFEKAMIKDLQENDQVLGKQDFKKFTNDVTSALKSPQFYGVTTALAISWIAKGMSLEMNRYRVDWNCSSQEHDILLQAAIKVPQCFFASLIVCWSAKKVAPASFLQLTSALGFFGLAYLNFNPVEFSDCSPILLGVLVFLDCLDCSVAGFLWLMTMEFSTHSTRILYISVFTSLETFFDVSFLKFIFGDDLEPRIYFGAVGGVYVIAAIATFFLPDNTTRPLPNTYTDLITDGQPESK